MSTMSSSIEVAKAALRKKVAQKIATLTTEEKQQQSQIVFDKLVKLPVFQEAKRVSVFLSTPNEIDTEPIVRQIFEDQKKCFVPRYSKAGMQMVRLASMEDWNSLPVTKWNIKQPLLKEEREDALATGGLDLLICPGVAFTLKGDRLGHGGGYYDAFITKLKQQGSLVSTVAVGFNEQIFDSIPVSSSDVTIDLVLFASNS